MEQNITKEMLDEYKNNLIATKNYIPIYQEANGEVLYLKDYSKVVRGIGDTEIPGIPEKFEEEEITIIENPTEEEKVILATNLPNVDNTPYLEAIVNGRSILEKMSRDEAAVACNMQKGKIIEGLVCGRLGEADRKELELIKLTKAYLDGRLYGKSVAALTMFANASLIAENVKEENRIEVESEIKQETTDSSSISASEENETEKALEDTTEQQVVVPKVKEASVDIEIPKVEPLPELTVDVPKEEVAIPSVPTEEEPTPSVLANEMPKEQSVEVPSVMPATMDYQQMVDYVVGGAPSDEGISMTEATELLKQPEVPTMPVVPTPEPQPQIETTSEIPQSVISTPTSLEQMATEIPSFEGSLGGRSM